MKTKLILSIAGLALAASIHSSAAFDLGIAAFQMSSETHARAANAAEQAAKEFGWNATVLNANGTLPTHADQIENLIQKQVDGIVLVMSKPVEFEAQIAAAKEAGIPVITIMSGASENALFDVQVNEYAVGADAALYLLGQMNYSGPILTARFDSNMGTRIRGKELDTVLSENTAVTVAGSYSMAKTQSWQEDVRNGMNALILQNAGNFKGIWASFDGQAFIIDDLLLEQGMQKGDVPLVSIDGGQEAFSRIKDPDSMMTATVVIPFEEMGEAAVASMKRIAVDKESKDAVTSGPYLFLKSTLVDKSNVDSFIK